MHGPIPRLGESLDLVCVPMDDSASATLILPKYRLTACPAAPLIYEHRPHFVDTYQNLCARVNS